MYNKKKILFRKQKFNIETYKNSGKKKVIRMK
jgi:hypothetical protein